MTDDASMGNAWRRRIDRAAALATGPATPLMTSVRELLTIQSRCYDTLHERRERLTGAIEADLAELRVSAEPALAAAAAVAPPALAAERPRNAAEIDSLLRDAWRSVSLPFFARLVLQPYAELLAELASAGSDHRRQGPSGPPRATTAEAPADVRRDRGLETTPGRAACPFCGGPPQLAVLRSDGADGGGRTLLCATCSSSWPVRRIQCVRCGEEDERRLGYFHAPDFDHVRVDACETCRHYLKTIDLTRLGTAVPLVDEVAAGALDLWAVERGYRKIEPNLIGL